MNIFSEVEKVNQKNLSTIALGIRKSDKTTVRYTYKQMFEKVEQCYNNFEKLGIKQGYRIGIVAPSSPEWTINYLAIQKINATAVLLDSSLEKEELIKLINKSDLRAVILSNSVKEKIGIVEDMPNIDLSSFGELFDRSSKNIRQTSVEESCKVSSIIFSSGTTRTASGIMHSADSLIKTTYMTINTNKLKKKSVFMGMLPNSHIYGVITQILGPLLLGGSVYHLESLDAESLVGALNEYKPNIIPSVPKVYELLYSQILKKIESKNFTKVMFQKLFPICLKLRYKTGINLGKYIFSSVQKGFGGRVDAMCSAGAPISKEVAEFFYGTGFKMLVTYGATETNIPTVGNYGKHLTMDSCGKNYPDVQIKIDDTDELLIKSPYMMLGYFNDAKATSQTFTQDGWFKTGDLARFNEKGNVEILGRCKENIVLSTGKKIAPDDIEKNYQNIPYVEDITICGIPSEAGSYDEVHCFAVVEDGKQNKVKELIQKRSSESSINMKVKGIHFVNEIPRTALQKPKRFLLIKEITKENEAKSNNLNAKPVTMKDTIYELIARIANVDIAEIKDNTKILLELPIDSLSEIELEIEIEKLYGVNNLNKLINKNLTAEQLVNIVANPPQKQGGKIKQFLSKYPLMKKEGDYKIFKFYTNLIKKIYKVSINNEEILPENSAYIICSNHVSNFDYLYLTANFSKNRFKNFYCVAKEELFKKCFLNKAFTRISGMIPIDRNGTATETVKKVEEKIQEKSGIMIFPEGTRSKTGKLGDCKKGAAKIALETNTPIIPAYIQGAYEIYPPTKKLPKLFNWKSKKKYEVNVYYGEPIKSDGKTIEQLTQEVRDAILELSYKYGTSKKVLVV